MAAPDTGQGPERGAEFCGEKFGGNREPEAKPRQSISLTEGAQHDDATRGHVRGGAGAGLKKIDEGFVDNQDAAMFA